MPLQSATNPETFQDRIAQATLRLVADRGADGVTTVDVIRATGTTDAAMARCCRTESDLWRIVIGFVERRMAASWGAILSSKQSPAERLRTLLAVQIGLLITMPALREILLTRGLHGSNPALRHQMCDVRARFPRVLCEILRDGVRLGQLPPGLDPDETACRVTEALQAMVASWPPDGPRDDAIEEGWARLDALAGCALGQRAKGTTDAVARDIVEGS
jgi:AcrR family transcriptional regulator